MLGIAPESPASGARFVGWRFVAQDSLAVKDLPAKNLTRLLHETLMLATNQNTIFKNNSNSKELC
jgi:hypothetical protein